MTEASESTWVQRLARPAQEFLAVEASSSLLLLGATVAALVWANSPWSASYFALWHAYLGPLSLEHWVNDGLMALFFFVVGMEIKHELTLGQLATRAQAMLPVFGALGGMVAPALLYVALQPGGDAAAGWGIPMATDIAFAVAALTVLGKRVPPPLKVFLLALAIVDDLGAVLVIAFFYTEKVRVAALAGAAVGLGLIYGLKRAGVRSYLPYWIVGAAVWAATLASGVHATVAGVVLGLLAPARPLGDAPGPAPIEQLTHQLHPWVAFLVLPIFALANAGVAFDGQNLGNPAEIRVALAVGIGLLVGKPLGITAFALAAAKLGIAVLPRGVGAGAVLGAGALGGIGFTMALFITALAFPSSPFSDASKVGVLGASLAATALGLAILARALPRDAAGANG